jgi:D-sedoheptulose 7-phosphate isomerase
MTNLSSETQPAQINDPVDEYLTRLEQTVRRLSRQDIWAIIQVFYRAWQEQRQIFLIGNGGSAATASHMANDLNKLTVVEGMPRMKAIALTDNVPLMTAWSNDTSYENAFSEQMRNFIRPGDIVVCISTSGNSASILSAVEVGRQFDATIIGFTGDPGGRLRQIADYCVAIPDDHIGRQEDGHMILDHVIANTLRDLIVTAKQTGGSK